MLPELAPKIHWLFVNNSLISRESLKSWVLNLFSLFLCPQSFFSAWLKTANSLQLCTINLGPIASFIDIFEQVIDRPKPCLSCVCITVKSFGQSDCTHKCKTLLQTFLFYHQLFYQSKGLCCLMHYWNESYRLHRSVAQTSHTKDIKTAKCTQLGSPNCSVKLVCKS